MDPKQALIFISDVVKNSSLPVKVSEAQAYLNQLQLAFTTIEAALSSAEPAANHPAPAPVLAAQDSPTPENPTT